MCQLEYSAVNEIQNHCSETKTGLKDARGIETNRQQIGCVLVGCSRHTWGYDSRVPMYKDTQMNRNLREGAAGSRNIITKAARAVTDEIVQYCDVKVKAKWVPENPVTLEVGKKMKHISAAGSLVTTIFWVALVIDLVLFIGLLACSVKLCKKLSSDDDDDDSEDSY